MVAERHRPGTLLPVRSEGRLELVDEPNSAVARAYGTAFGQALFRDAIHDALVQARSEAPDGVRVLVICGSRRTEGVAVGVAVRAR